MQDCSWVRSPQLLFERFLLPFCFLKSQNETRCQPFKKNFWSRICVSWPVFLSIVLPVQLESRCSPPNCWARIMHSKKSASCSVTNYLQLLSSCSEAFLPKDNHISSCLSSKIWWIAEPVWHCSKSKVYARLFLFCLKTVLCVTAERQFLTKSRNSLCVSIVLFFFSRLGLAATDMAVFWTAAVREGGPAVRDLHRNFSEGSRTDREKTPQQDNSPKSPG